MPINDLMDGIIIHARNRGTDSQKILNMVIFDVWDDYKDKDMNQPEVKLKYSCEVVSNYYTAVDMYEKRISCEGL